MLLGAGCSTGLARLGDSPQNLDQRYGTPVATAAVGAFTRCRYEKQGYTITVFYQNERSVLEIFAKRGMSQDEAAQVVNLVAAHPVGSPYPAQETQIRQATGITCRDEVFWAWTGPTLPVDAAYNPIECTLAFFSEPAVYASIQQALASDAPGGS